jgi:hypothetical protein
MAPIKPFIMPADLAWVEDHLADVLVTCHSPHMQEITGIIKVEAGKPAGTMKEGLVHLMTKFLLLIDELNSRAIALDRLPEVVIGQIGDGYRAQVTLTIRSDSYKSPYTGASPAA